MKDRNTPTFKTRQEIANELGISRRTLLRKMKESQLDVPNGRLDHISQEKIYSLFYKNGMDLSHLNRNHNVS